jgi:hypothetical protein
MARWTASNVRGMTPKCTGNRILFSLGNARVGTVRAHSCPCHGTPRSAQTGLRVCYANGITSAKRRDDRGTLDRAAERQSIALRHAWSVQCMLWCEPHERGCVQRAAYAARDASRLRAILFCVGLRLTSDEPRQHNIGTTAVDVVERSRRKRHCLLSSGTPCRRPTILK